MAFVLASSQRSFLVLSETARSFPLLSDVHLLLERLFQSVIIRRKAERIRALIYNSLSCNVIYLLLDFKAETFTR